MSWGPEDRWYAPSRPLAADGIKARSRTGDIGTSWWSKRFLEVLESMGIANRLQRGRRYARAGQVLDLVVAAGRVTARVQGSRPSPYSVTISALPIPANEWARVEEALSGRAVFLAKLLAGEMPPNVEEAFSGTASGLFPSSLRELGSVCTCPDLANPCKHIAAVFYILAEAFDDDPFRIFAWRGRTREEIMTNLRARRGTTLAAAVVGGGPGRGGWALPYVDESEPSAGPAVFFGTGDAAPPGRRAPAGTHEAGEILLALEPLGLEVRGEPFVEAVRRAYPHMAEWALQRLLEY